MAKMTWTNQVDIQAQKLQAAHDSKIAELKAECSNAIFEGFKSETVGHEFGFNELDQANFTQQLLIIVSKGGPSSYTEKVECKTKAGTVEYIAAADFIELVTEAELHKRTQQRKFWSLELKVKSAVDVEAIKNISW